MKKLTVYVPGEPARTFTESKNCTWKVKLTTRVVVTISSTFGTTEIFSFNNIPFIEATI